MTWSVYMVRCSDDSLYTGIAKDVAARVDRHNKGTGAKYTRSRTPVRLVFQFDGCTKSAALKLEYWIKQWSRTDKEALISYPSVVTHYWKRS